jgi:hypothetical protein
MEFIYGSFHKRDLGGGGGGANSLPISFSQKIVLFLATELKRGKYKNRNIF